MEGTGEGMECFDADDADDDVEEERRGGVSVDESLCIGYTSLAL